MSATEMSLKPCPFCGGKADYFEERLFYVPLRSVSWKGVKCQNCGGAYIDADENKSPIDVYEAWNKRAFTMNVNQYGNNSKCIGYVENLKL